VTPFNLRDCDIYVWPEEFMPDNIFTFCAQLSAVGQIEGEYLVLSSKRVVKSNKLISKIYLIAVISSGITKPSPARKIDSIPFIQTKRQFKTDFIARLTNKV
jgi:hypothetical protein